MATIVTKNSSTASAVPTTSDLVQGELAVNVTDKRIFTENASTQIVELGTNPSTVTTATATVTGTLTANGTFASSNAVITGGSVNSTPIGATTASTGNFSALSISGTAITATANEINLLDGVTATTAELNFIDGVTSSIQTQLNTKAPLASPTFTGTVTADGLSLGDNAKATFGNSNDLEIYHDGSHSYISDVGQGDLRISGSSLVDIKCGADIMFRATEGGATQLRYGGLLKLATTATGIDVTGTATMGGLTVDGDAKISGALPRLILSETDATDLNTAFRNNGGVLKIQTVNDAENSFTSRLDINNSTGDISFYENTGTTPKFYWDASAESLGIGTTSPDTTLTVVGSGIAEFRVGNIGPSNNSAIRISRNDTVVSVDNPLGYLEFGGNDSTGNVDMAFAYVGGVADGGHTAGSNPTALTFGVTDVSTEVPVERMRIDRAGNVGIGTDNPVESLHSAGNIRFGDTGPAELYTNSAELRLGVDRNNDNAASDITFYANNDEKMRINSLGNVGIGNSSPGRKLNVNSLGIQIAAVFESTSTSSTRISLVDANTTADNYVSVASSGNDLALYAGAAERVRIDSSGNLLMGGTANVGGLQVDATNSSFRSSGATAISILDTDVSNDAFKFNIENGGRDGRIGVWQDVIFSNTSAGETVRIDNNGNLLVGKTATSLATVGIEAQPNGLLRATADSQISAVFRRNTTDGNIAVFLKDGTTVGNISTKSGEMYLGSANTGVRFYDAGDAITPFDVTGDSGRDNAIDIGVSTTRFKDLYLSGGVYLGGTTSANLLNDYEEGTFTPVIADAVTGGNEATTTTATGKYTKVGNLVTIVVDLLNIDTTGLTTGVAIILRDVPFQAASSPGGVNYTGSVLGGGTFNSPFTVFAAIQDNLQYVRFQNAETSGVSNFLNIGNINSGITDIRFSLTYQTA